MVMELQLDRKIDITELNKLKEVVALIPTHKDFDIMRSWVSDRV